MKKTISNVWVLVFIIGLIPVVARARLVACVGDSITYGYGIPNRNDNSYPAQLAMILRGFDSEWETQNFGHSGATLLRSKSASYVTKAAYNNALASEPDLVFIMLGSNDSARASITEIEQNFIGDYLALIDSFAQLPSQPRIFVCYPPPIFGGGYGSDNTIRNVINPLIQQLPEYRTVEVIDMYTALKGCGHLFPDLLHPNAEGAGIIAETVASAILGFRFFPDFNGDGKIDIEDMIKLIDHWGQNEPALDIAPAPLGDGMVGRADLEVLMTFWGREINDPMLASHWALDETEGVVVTDSAGESDGYALGGPVWRADGGVVGGALEFDGVDDFISAPAVLNPADGPFSVLAWVKGGGPGQVIISGSGASDWLSLDLLTGSLMTDLKAVGRGAAPLLSQTVITDGSWHRIGLVWDGLYRTLYINGIAVAEDTQSNLEGSTSGLYIGCGDPTQPGTFFSGLIDDVRIYNRAINP